MSERNWSAFALRCFLLTLVAGIAIVLLMAPKPWQHPPLAKFEDYVRVYSWWAGFINLVPLAFLALTTRWWMRALPAFIPKESAPQLPRGFLPCLAGAMVACALLGFPRLGQSLWEDEVYSVRRCILGEYRVKDDGTVERAYQKVCVWVIT